MEKKSVVGIRAQAAVEFLIIMGIALFFFTTFFLVIQKNTEEKNLEKEIILVEDLALKVQGEINLASKASDGYSREFKIENTILGKEYNISIADRRIYVKTDKAATSYKISDVKGNIQKGVNVIRKNNGTIYLN